MIAKKSNPWVPVGLVFLSLVPSIAGVMRLVSLSGTEPPGANAKEAGFFADPLPVALHVFGATLYCLLGALQFSQGLRQRHPGWHRAAGRIALPAGLVAAASGVWMALAYPLMPEFQGGVLLAFRLVVGPAMAACLILGWMAVIQRRLGDHRAWMMRAYALGQGAGTQALIGLPWSLAFGAPEGLPRDLLLGVGWVINVALVEVLLARRRVRP